MFSIFPELIPIVHARKIRYNSENAVPPLFVPSHASFCDPYMKFPICLLLFGLCLQSLGGAAAQGVQQMVIEQSDEFSYSGSAGVRSLKGNVRLRHNRTLLYCDSALMFDGGRQARAYGRVRIVEPGENLQVRCRYLEYDAEAGIARLFQDVVLSDDELRLYAPELSYNTSKREVTYNQGARMEDGKARLNSRLGRYAVESGEMIFNRDVVLEDDSLSLSADSLRYNRKSGRMYFIAPTRIESRGTEMETSGGWYELRARIGHFYPMCEVRHDNRYFLWSDSLFVGQNQASGTAAGRVQWIDTVQKFEIRAGWLQFDRSKNFYKAWGKPILRSFSAEKDDTSPAQTSLQGRQTRDTFNLTSDTITAQRVLPSGSAPNTDSKSEPQQDSTWLFKAWGMVAGQSKDAVMSCDSLVYHQTDSLAVLTGAPLIWPSTFQLSGQIIQVKFRGNNSGTLMLPRGGVLADRLNDSLFHQITAAQILLAFDSASIQYLHAVDRAMALYHVTGEDSGYIGLNKISSDTLNMFFDKQRPKRMVFLGKPEGILWPPAEVPAGEDTVAGFQWQGERKEQALEQILQSRIENPNRGGYELFPANNSSEATELNKSRATRRKNRKR